AGMVGDKADLAPLEAGELLPDQDVDAGQHRRHATSGRSEGWHDDGSGGQRGYLAAHTVDIGPARAGVAPIAQKDDGHVRLGIAPDRGTREAGMAEAVIAREQLAAVGG